MSKHLQTDYAGKTPHNNENVSPGFPAIPTSATTHSDDDKTIAKSEAASIDYLHVPYNVTRNRDVPRVPSPSDTLSILSLDEINELRRGRNSPFSLSRARATTGGQQLPGHIPYSNPNDLRESGVWARTKDQIAKSWLKNKGVALVMLSQVFATLMNVTTRLLEVEGNEGKGLHPFQILFARMSITFVLASLYMWRNKTEDFPFGKKEVRLILMARGLSGFFGVFGMYYSLLYLPLADATVITFLAPSLAWWACSYLINEPFTRMEQLAAYIALGGVVLIARPTSLFAHPSPSANSMPDIAPALNATASSSPAHPANDYDQVTPSQRAGAVGIALIGVLGSACAYTTIRWIGRRAHPLLSVNYFAAWCTVVSVVMMLALPEIGFLLPKGLKEWSYLIFLGICGFVMQFLLAAGLQYEKSSRATNVTYTQMLFALFFDKVVFGHTPDILSIIGSSLVLGSAIYVAVQKSNANSGRETGGRGYAINNESARGDRRDEERGLVEGMDDDDEGVERIQERTSAEDIQLRTMRV